MASWQLYHICGQFLSSLVIKVVGIKLIVLCLLSCLTFQFCVTRKLVLFYFSSWYYTSCCLFTSNNEVELYLYIIDVTLCVKTYRKFQTGWPQVVRLILFFMYVHLLIYKDCVDNSYHTHKNRGTINISAQKRVTCDKVAKKLTCKI